MERKSKIKKISIALVLGYVCYILVNQQITIRNKKAQLESYKVELDKAMKEHERLVDETKISKTYRYVERLAREKLGFIKQGENAVIQKND
ncbi:MULTISPECIES: FtsB family cell division protein [Clostridium]|uniref:Cell division protein FtsL n=2 Tax=Clostridium TaxID=1485 RepID=A0A151ALY5_9CLOT|nr:MULTISPECIES: septum formation initiator family protein [Clostridium]KYH28634.1 cell division protein FtsL [Clostridium colicanis DSM 13634]MBE6045029.1 septum formation initiator family protein [Clostridium thermopalmarium]PRR73340.1 Cell division protein FtsL [Clostridium thermopalmarium DSM 5974]PVZ22174.1 septum formation initiator [Clostridium thermopalmarium DSM 5974]